MKKTVVVLLHCAYWLMYLLLLALFFGLFSAELRTTQTGSELQHAFFTWWRLMSALAVLPGVIGFYSNYSLLFNRFLRKKRFGLFFLGLLLTGIVATALSNLTLRFVLPDAFASVWREIPGGIGVCIFMFFLATVNGVLGLVMNGFISWYADIRLKEELERKTTATELALIKAQLNPHFLFNTINNIDVLITKDPAQASHYLNTLSDLLRFMLYEANTEQTLLEAEISHIHKYIDLQRIRSTNPDFISFTVNGGTGNRKIAPMLFIPFIENAFKHAENKKLSRAVEIEITVASDTIVFLCKNDCTQHAQQAPGVGGLGNALIRKRLQLLYPEKHRLHVAVNGNTYLVQLEIDA
jgi:hypothetical protein